MLSCAHRHALHSILGVFKRACVCLLAVAYPGLKGESNPLPLSSGSRGMCLLVVQWVCWGRAGALRSLLSSFKLRSLHGLALDSVSVGQGCRQEPCLMHEQFSRCVPHRAGLTDTNTSVILTRLSCYLCSLHTARERQGRSSRNLVPSPPFGYQTEQ